MSNSSTDFAPIGSYVRAIAAYASHDNAYPAPTTREEESVWPNRIAEQLNAIFRSGLITALFRRVPFDVVLCDGQTWSQNLQFILN